VNFDKVIINIKMIWSSLFLTFCLIIAGVSSEYVWTGTEWKWNEPGAGQTPDKTIPDTPNNGGSISGGSIEGSGGGSDYGDDQYDEEDDYDDDYNYDDKEDDYDYGKPNNGNAKMPTVDNAHSNTGILPATDDEDLVEGSGDAYNVGSGSFGRDRDPVTSPPRRNQDVFVEDDYKEDDYDEENYKEDDDIVFGSDNDDDYTKDIIVEVTAKPTQFAYPATPAGTTTRRPIHQYTDAPEVHKERPSNRPASFFAQPGILAAVIGGAVVGLLCAILLVMFIVYRMRKKDEGSYALDEPKRSHNVNSYSKPPSREFYA